MLELMGKGYVIDHCICEHNRWIEDHNEKVKEHDYRMYMTEMVRGIANTLGMEVNVRYADFYGTQTEHGTEKTGDEIALEVINKLGLKTA